MPYVFAVVSKTVYYLIFVPLLSSGINDAANAGLLINFHTIIFVSLLFGNVKKMRVRFILEGRALQYHHMVAYSGSLSR